MMSETDRGAVPEEALVEFSQRGEEGLIQKFIMDDMCHTMLLELAIITTLVIITFPIRGSGEEIKFKVAPRWYPSERT